MESWHIREGDSAGRWKRWAALLVGVLFLTGGALVLFHAWQVPPAQPTPVHAAALAAARAAFLPPTVSTPPPVASQLSPSGELLSPPQPGDKTAAEFQRFGIPGVPGIQFLCNGWVDGFSSGFSASERFFASPDTPAALIAFYRRQLGDKGMTRTGEDRASWDLPVAADPEWKRLKTLRIEPYYGRTQGLLEDVSKCGVQPKFAAHTQLTLVEGGGPARPWK